jgi:hypothetical protein
MAYELIRLVESVAHHGGRRNVYKSFRQAVASLRNKTTLQEMSDRLDVLRNELILRVVVSLKMDPDPKRSLQSALNDEQFTHMKDENKRIAENLLDNKNFFTTGFDNLRRSQEAKHRHEETIAAIATLQGQFQAAGLSDALNHDALSCLEKIQEDIVNFLWFRFIGDRHAEIAETYGKTFQWVFDRQFASDYVWSSLSKWLELGEGCFWINGKAASGKSTLMKYIGNEPRTQQLLATWAGGEPLLFSSFYFWNAGTILQKSQHGLLRTILYQILNQCPALIPIVFPSHCRSFARRKLIDAPSLMELKDALKRLTTQTITPQKICLLIDGVDEYDGNHVELVEYLRSISSPNLKLLLSSRPTSPCTIAFTKCPTLKLQDFTQADIHTYVAGNLATHARFRELARWEKHATENIIRQVVTKASGVFLWVALVVRALQHGLHNYDGVEDLQARLDELPSDLDKLYQKIFIQMDPIYKRQASMLLQIMYQSSQMPANSPMTPQRLSFALQDNPDAAIDASIEEISAEERAQKHIEIAEKIRSRCCGLLEVHVPNQRSFRGAENDARRDTGVSWISPRSNTYALETATHNYMQTNPDRDSEAPSNVLIASNYDELQVRLLLVVLFLIIVSNAKDAANHSEVQFLHKSVVDFLEKPTIWTELQGITASRGFDPNVALVSASLREIKAAPKELDTYIDSSSIWNILSRALRECYLAECSTGESQNTLLEDLDATMESHWRAVQGWIPRFDKSLSEMEHWSCVAPSSESGRDWNHGGIPYNSMFSLACRFGLVRYVESVINTSTSRRSKIVACLRIGEQQVTHAQMALLRTILDIAESRLDSTLWEAQFAVLDVSLKNGADVNLRSYKGQTAFEIALHRCNPLNSSDCKDWARIFERLIDAGADVNFPYLVDTYGGMDDLDVRLFQAPLTAIEERFSAAEKMSSRASGCKIKIISRSLQRLFVNHGAESQEWFEEETKNGDGNRIFGQWEKITAPDRIERLMNHYGLR